MTVEIIGNQGEDEPTAHTEDTGQGIPVPAEEIISEMEEERSSTAFS